MGDINQKIDKAIATIDKLQRVESIRGTQTILSLAVMFCLGFLIRDALGVLTGDHPPGWVGVLAAMVATATIGLSTWSLLLNKKAKDILKG